MTVTSEHSAAACDNLSIGVLSFQRREKSRLVVLDKAALGVLYLGQ
jgi:hypothetical protein